MALGCRDEWAWGANASSIWHCQHICLSKAARRIMREEGWDPWSWHIVSFSSILFRAFYGASEIPIHNYLYLLISNLDRDIPNHGLFFCSKHRTRGELGKSNNELWRQLGSSRYRKRISRAVNLHTSNRISKSVPINVHLRTRPCLLHMMLLAW